MTQDYRTPDGPSPELRAMLTRPAPDHIDVPVDAWNLALETIAELRDALAPVANWHGCNAVVPLAHAELVLVKLRQIR